MFGKYIEMGVLDVISPPPEFYPDMTNLKLSLGDKLERVQWRSKQVKNLFSFIHKNKNSSKCTFVLSSWKKFLLMFRFDHVLSNERKSIKMLMDFMFCRQRNLHLNIFRFFWVLSNNNKKILGVFYSHPFSQSVVDIKAILVNWYEICNKFLMILI